jgi:hypothetical protein
VLTNSGTGFCATVAGAIQRWRQFQIKRVPSSEVLEEDGEGDISRQREIIAVEARELKVVVWKNTIGQPVKN